MELHCDCGEPTAVGEPPQPSGKLNRTAFKLLKRRKSGGAMPSIFGVRGGKGGKSGEGGGGGGGPGGMVRSRTHDGLAEAVLESGKKEEPAGGGGGGAGGDPPGDEARDPSSSSSSSSAAGKAHGFFALWRKSGGKGERPKGRGGLKGLFSSMRWPRRDSKPADAREDEAGESSGSQPSPSLLLPGSLTASLECIKEEAQRAPAGAPPGLDQPPPPRPAEAVAAAVAAEKREGEPQGPQRSPRAEEPPGRMQPAEEAPESHDQGTPADAAITGDLPIGPPPPVEPDREGSQEKAAAPDPSSLNPPSEPSIDRICLMFADVTSLKSFDSLTGCGDIIADQDDDAGSGGGSAGGGSDKSAAGVGKPAASTKPPGVLAYQGGGEEMASPEQVGDTCTPEFWDTLSQVEEKSQETPGATESLEASKDGGRVRDGLAGEKHIGLNQPAVHHKDQKIREKEQQEVVPSSDEGYWDSTTPGPEEDNTNSIQKEVIPRDSYSGDALYDLYADPDENSAVVTSSDATSVTCCKPLSPVTSTCPAKMHTTSLKDSKIPISIKHFTSPHGSHGPDASNSHHIAHHPPTKSEIPRTKIPVSKVLVHRASYRSLAGTTGKTATYHESAKK